MTLTPEAAAFMQVLSDAKPPFGNPTIGPAEIRRIIAAEPPAPSDPSPVGRVEERMLPGQQDERPARIYWPAGSNDGTLPVVMFIHGGGWIISTLDTHDALCRNMCNMAEAIIVSVHPRYADEASYPGPVEDSYAMLRWVADNAVSLGGEPNRIAIAGDSSGGNLAAAVALMCRDRGGPTLVHQMLIYPVMNNDFNTSSYQENGRDYFITTNDMRWFWEQYVGDPDAQVPPYAAPVQASDLSGVAPARIITGEHDPLRDEGETYARLLDQAGVAVTCKRYTGMFHGFFSFPQVFGGSQEANEREFGELRERLRQLD